MEGHIQARVDLGSGSRAVEHNQFVSDGQWHTILFRRLEGQARKLTTLVIIH
jgi:hypothetical protein